MSRPLAIDLPNGGTTVIDETDVAALAGLSWHRTAAGYAAAMASKGGRRTLVLLHRHLLDPPPGTHVDHINGDKLDNRRSNLRVVSPSINQVNRKRLNRNNSSGVRGVSWIGGRRKKWVAQITVDGRHRFLGHFDSLADAVNARRAAELSSWGELCPVP